MSALLDLDHARLRRAERSWLDQCAERLRMAATTPDPWPASTQVAPETQEATR